jgi:hypothetical protein
MDGKTQGLKERKDWNGYCARQRRRPRTFKRRSGGTAGPIHFSQIEAAAHAVGSQLSGGIQERVVREAVIEVPAKPTCPQGGALCRTKFERRSIASTDGHLMVLEPFGHCRHCRRGCFSSA